MSGSGIKWAICKSAPRSRQRTMPAPHHSCFTGRKPFLPPSQQRQSTEGTVAHIDSMKTHLSYMVWPVRRCPGQCCRRAPAGWRTAGRTRRCGHRRKTPASHSRDWRPTAGNSRASVSHTHHRGWPTTSLRHPVNQSINQSIVIYVFCLIVNIFIKYSLNLLTRAILQ